MSVKQALLALLEQGPMYGYQLRSEFERRTGSTWPLNVGQVYTTLTRLERDGLVEGTGGDGEGHVFYRLTTDGSAEVRAWFTTPVARSQPPRDELAIRSEEHTSELQSRQDLHSFPTRRSSDLDRLGLAAERGAGLHDPDPAGAGRAGGGHRRRRRGPRVLPPDH